MSTSPSSTSSPPPTTNERLDVPVLPPSSSRFVLPPPPSDLLNRLQAFLPQIKSANEQLQTQEDAGEVEEAVVMEEVSSDSEDDSSDSDDSEEDSSDQEEKENEEREGEEGRMDRLMDIGQRPKVIKKKLVVIEEDSQGMKQDEAKEEKR
ncbi:hypothetical protein JCM5353_007412 [Sporobolomyces roseus]